MTAMGQARSSDATPLRPRFGLLFPSLPDRVLLFRRLCFAFCNREWPEVVRFGEGQRERFHGGNASVLSYDRELRSAWYQLKGGRNINADSRDHLNDYPNVVIVTRGGFHGHLGGEERSLSEGEMVMIPAGASYEFWADAGEYGEFVWLAFGAAG